MNNSSLATLHVPAHTSNYTRGRSEKISKITVHHMAGKLSAQRCGELFQNPNRCGSAHYGIGNDGTIARYVDEENTAWTDGNWKSNCQSVTIEVSNSASGGNWKVSDAALNSLIALCADIAKRNALGKLEAGKNLTWHSMYAATACPGEYLKSKMDHIADKANNINYTKKEEIKVKITGINIPRATDYLVIYSGGSYTGTNKWGAEVALGADFVAKSDPVYGVGNMKIPKGGYVLSGHGKACNWILNNIKKGQKIDFTISVKG